MNVCSAVFCRGVICEVGIQICAVDALKQTVFEQLKAGGNLDRKIVVYFWDRFV